MSKILKSSVIAMAASSFASAAVGGSNDLIVPSDVTGPLYASEECAQSVIKNMLGDNARIVLSGKDIRYISGYAKDKGEEIFVSVQNGEVVGLGVNINQAKHGYFGWADLFYGPETSSIKLGGAEPLVGNETRELDEFITRVDKGLRACNAVAFKGPVPHLG